IDQNRNIGANYNNATPDRVIMGFNSINTSGRRGLSILDDLVVRTPSQWNLTGGGNWSPAGSWSSNGVPNAIDAAANLGSSITGPATVTLNTAQTVGTLNFDNSNQYIVAGSNALTFDVSSGVAGISVTS